jgi:tRNA A-37 threonylcarbamoyl transferase component Bud32/tetratricopeptide (TPR) repeat protein
MVGAECPSDETLVAHVAGELTAASGDELRAHLDGCDACRGVMIALARGTPQGATPSRADTVVAVRRLRVPEPLDLPARYRVDRLLGEGGMGRVFAAHDLELDRKVAVKVMRPDLASAGLADRLVRESRLMARLSHPGVVMIYDVGRHEGRVYIAMELIAGVTLQRWLHARRRSWREIVDVFCRAGDGIIAAHAAGLVHRDIKPENILLALDGDRVTRVAVSDFGVARAAHEAEGGVAPRTSVNSMSLTATGTAVGTPAYMPPEQLAGDDVGARSDVFSFGVSLWEALWGARPYRGGTVAELKEVMARGVPQVPARPGEKGAESTPPRWLARVLLAAIEPDAARRTPSMQALLGALVPERRDRRRRFAAVGVLALGAVGAAAYVVRPHAAARPAMCGDAGLANVWNFAARTHLRATLGALPGDVAPTVAERAIGAADSFAERWQIERHAACTIDDVPHRDAALICLDGRRRALATVIARVPWMQPADQVQLDERLAQVPSIEACRTDAAQLVIRDVPPAQRGRVAELEARLDEIEALALTGTRGEAERAVAQLSPAIAETGSRVLLAEQSFVTSQAIDAEQIDRQLAALRDAAVEAAKVGRDDLAAQAWLQIAESYVDEKTDAARAEDALVLADSAIARGGEDRALRARHQLELAHLRSFQSKFAEAHKILDALAAHVARDGPQLLDGVDAQRVDLLVEAGELDEAMRAARAMIESRTRRLGAGHVRTVQAHTMLSRALLTHGDDDGALAEARLAAELTRHGYGDASDAYGDALRNLAVALDEAGKTDESLATIHRARDILVATRGPRSYLVGDTFHDEAVALSAGGRFAESLPLFDQALAIYHDSVGDKHVRAAEAMLSLATTLGQLGRGTEAVARARQAVAMFREAYSPEHPRYAMARSYLGEALIHAGDKRAAQIELEAALAILDKDPSWSPIQRAAVRFNLAQSLVDDPAQHARALELGRQAKEVFDADPQWRDVGEHIGRWIKSGGKE